VIAHRGRLVEETALAGYSPQDLHDVRSVGKSFTSALAGLAADRGELGLDERVLDVLGLSSTDPRWRRMKVRHLLSMSSGLDCEDEMPGSPGDEDHMREQPEPNWHRFTLGLPMAREPGAAGVYCTAGINLIGALLARRWGGWLPQHFFERLARPLGISRFQMILMPDGQGYLGGGLRLTPRDMAKLGQLYVDGGRWQGKQLLSARYVAEATAAHAGLSEPDDYGLGFWRTSFRVGQVDYPAFYASGNGGQLIIGLPSLRAVVVFTSGNYANRRAWQRILDDLMPRYVIPALLGRP
jgi:CubicO group peptidase (beta-lactamase class C family)